MKIYWTTATSGSFSTVGDWSTGTLPGPSDIAALLASGSPYTVTISSTQSVLGINTASNVTLDIAGSYTNFTDFAGTAGGANRGTINIENSGYLFIIDGSFDNVGTVTLGSTGLSTELDGASLLYGAGTVTMSDNISDKTIINNVLAIGTNVDNAISGSGTVWLDLNQKSGVVNANSTDGIIIVAPNLTIQNAGLFEATNTGGLYLEDTIDDSSGGTILADNAPVFLGDSVVGGVIWPGLATIIGGTLESLGTGSIQIPAEGYAELNGGNGDIVTIEGNISIADSGQLAVFGVIDNTGQILLNGSTTGADLFFGLETSTIGDTTLEGKGTIVLGSGDLGPNIKATLTKTPVITNVNNTIEGVGEITSITLINDAAGVIDADSATGSLGLRGVSVTNDGLMEATSDAILGMGGDTITNTTTGQMEAASGARLLLDDDTIIGGTLSGAVELTGPGPNPTFTTFDGSVAPIFFQGTLTTLFGAPAFKGVIDNTGQIESDFVEVESAKSTNQVTLKGNGSIVLEASGVGISTASAALPAVTLLNSNHISGIGVIGSSNLILDNQTAGIIEASPNDQMVINTGTNTVVNAGTMQADAGSALLVESALDNSGKLEANNGFISISGAVSGAGTAVLSGTAQVEFAAVSSNDTQYTATTGERLILDDSQQYTGTVFGFAGTDQIDLADINSASATKSYSAGVLTVKDTDGHVAHIHFSGSYTLTSFSLSPDGNGGTLVTDPSTISAGASAGNVALLGSYMAALFASAEGQAIATTPAAETAQNEAVLAHPHTG